MTSINENGAKAPKITFVPESLVNKISAQDMGSRLRHGVSQFQGRRSQEKQTPIDELASFVFGLLDSVPSDVLMAVCNSMMVLMGDQDLSDIEKKQQIEDLLDLKRSLTTFEMDKLVHIAQAHLRDTSIDEDSMDNDSDLDMLVDSDVDEVDKDPHFVSINDPIRIFDTKTVRAQDVDSQWLSEKLKNSNMSVSDLLASYEDLSQLSLIERQLKLESDLGPFHLNFAHILNNNFDVIMLYTKLALAPNGIAREAVLEEINLRNLSIEDQISSLELPHEVDLESVGRPISAPINLRVDLPPNSLRSNTSDYVQYTIPSQEPSPIDWDLRRVDELPEFVKPGFHSISKLNPIQSKVCETAVHTDVNMLVCAPTGSGKTNIALLALMRCLHMKSKIVYVSPQKALVQEQVSVLQSRLPDFQVAELSGDHVLSRYQMKSLDVIVVTPEKWDIISRKKANIDIVRSVGLVVIDEIHLLHDERRGGVIENIAVRHKHFPDTRIIGLSATLPNYIDVASFLKVPSSGLFYFDASFRPVPLEQQYIGIQSTNLINQRKQINVACVDKVTETAITKEKQVLVFVHSRKDTAATRDLIIEETKLSENQVGIHHAGLTRNERKEAEESFRTGEFRVLVCTATLAWGINLPAATVIIKGTQLYNPNSSGWQPLSPQDVLQMLGRAGRPGYDAQGLGVIITTSDYLGYYASVATLSLPIESHLMNRICDSLNAEVVLNNVRNLKQACDWLSQTYWAVRWRTDPRMYGNDFELVNVAHSALCELRNCGALLYSYPEVRPTTLGELAATFYITPASMTAYSQKLKPWLSECDLLRVFSQCDEFKNLDLRAGEYGEVARLMELVPIPIRDIKPTKEAKICVLLQAIIGQMDIEGGTLQIDANYVFQSASRLIRAIFELALELNWGKIAKAAHLLYQQMEKQMWVSSSSLFKQFTGCPEILADRAQKCGLSWNQLFDLTKDDLSQILRIDDEDIHFAVQCLSLFPRFNVVGTAKPLTEEWFSVEIKISPQFEFDSSFHENFETFYVTLEDHKELILGYRRLLLRDMKDALTLSFHIKLQEFRPPYLFINILSDRWLTFSQSASISLRGIGVPTQQSNEYALSITNQDNEIEFPSNIDTANHTPLLRALEPLVLDINRTTYLGIPPGEDYKLCAGLVVAAHSRSSNKVLVLKPDNLKIDLEKVTILNVSVAEMLSRKPSLLAERFGDIDCLLCLDLHCIGYTGGYIYEALLTRLVQFWKLDSAQPRIVGLGRSLASAHSIGSWIGSRKSDVGNFGLDVKDPPLSILVEKFDGSFAATLKTTPVLNILNDGSKTLILVSSRSQMRVVQYELELGDFHNARVMNHSSIDVKHGQFDKLIVFHDSMDAFDLIAAVGLVSNEVLVYTNEPSYVAYILCNPAPCESRLQENFSDAILPSLCNGMVTDAQQAIEWLTSTFLYRRVKSNPGFYGTENIQNWASELVEASFEQLSASGLAEVADDDALSIKATDLAHIVCQTGATLKSLSDLEVVDEQSSLSELDSKLTLAVALNRPLSLLFKLIDQRQCQTQYLPFASSSLMQIPYIDESKALRCQDAGIKSIIDFIAIEDDDLRSQLVGFTNDDPKMVEIANFVNQFPMVDIIDARVEPVIDPDNRGDQLITIEIEHDIDFVDSETPPLIWYLVIGNMNTNTVYGFKKIEINTPTLVAEVIADRFPKKGTAVWLMCRDFIDADKEYQLT